MANYQKTQEAVEKAGLKYEKTGEDMKEEKWFEAVKNPRTGDFIQWSDLKQVGIDPPDEQTGKRKYPVKRTTSICRVQTAADDREYLVSNQYWIGLDRLGNEIGKSFDGSEVWMRPVLKYG